MDRALLYSIIYALVALEGREAALFGKSAPFAQRAFEKSLAGADFPQIWFELPLLGDPWFDVHILTQRETLTEENLFAHAEVPHHPEVFEWFAREQRGARQLALSYDTGNGDAENPAVQLLQYNKDPELTCDFLTVAGRPDGASAYRTFFQALPEAWFACYTGVFPQRPEANIRVECIPDPPLQKAYAADASLLEKHLRQIGFDAFGDTLLDRCQQLARAPFPIEFQFDLAPDGIPSSTISASLRFDAPSAPNAHGGFVADGEAGEVMRLVESWGLADQRWRLLEKTAFGRTISRQDSALKVMCYPAFIKLKWKDGEPFDAKAYLIVGTS